jgi:hypothetical protein
MMMSLCWDVYSWEPVWKHTQRVSLEKPANLHCVAEGRKGLCTAIQLQLLHLQASPRPLHVHQYQSKNILLLLVTLPYPYHRRLQTPGTHGPCIVQQCAKIVRSIDDVNV